MKVRNRRESEKIELDMTSMIDIVFQLLIFFVMTFKVIEMEGDFNIRMPAAGPSTGAPDTDILPPLQVRLRASAEGDLAGIEMDGRVFQSMAELHGHVLKLAGGGSGPGASDAEAEFDCDYNLKYANVVAAITAVSGTVNENGEMVKLIEKIKFAPPKKQ